MRHVRRLILMVVAALVTALGLPIGGALAAPRTGTESGAWVLRGSTVRAEDFTDQGLTTVTLLGGGTRLLTRGDDSIPPALAAQGWQHIGDPGSRAGYVLDAYQGAASATAKLFVLTAPDGSRVQLLHQLTPGEQYHNSFAAISPDERWFVAGEWGTMRRLLVFRMPATAPGSRVVSLPLSGVINLDRPVRNVQGCDFASPTSLVCSTNDTSTAMFGVHRPLLAVHLGRPVHGGASAAAVTSLGAGPTVPTCGGAQETEGIDVYGRRMLVSVVTACTRTTTVFRYQLEQSTTG